MKVAVVSWDWKSAGVESLIALLRLQADYPDEKWFVHLVNLGGDSNTAVFATERLTVEQAEAAKDDLMALQDPNGPGGYDFTLPRDAYVEVSEEWDDLAANYAIPPRLLDELAEMQRLQQNDVRVEFVDHRR